MVNFSFENIYDIFRFEMNYYENIINNFTKHNWKDKKT